MSLPEDSPYRNLFDSIPDTFKEDITVRFKLKTGEDDYNRPIFFEDPHVIRGRVDIQDAADQAVEEGGIRETTQAKIFLSLNDEIISSQSSNQSSGSLFDLFGYVGPPDPSKWTIINTPPAVNGSEAEIIPSTGVQSILTFLNVNPTFKVNYTGAPIPFIGILNISTGEGAFFWVSGSVIYCITQTPGPVAQSTPTVIPNSGTHKLFIDWQGAQTLFYIDDVLVATHNISPSNPLPVVMYQLGSGAGNALVDYVLVNKEIVIEFEFRGRRWAMMKDQYVTHLQREFLVQEVIPDG